MTSADARSPRLLFATGYTGVAVVLLAAVGYSIQVSSPSASAPIALSLVFIALNVVGWWAGGTLYARRPGDPLGITLLVMGDTLFPLNLYGPAVLLLASSRSRVPTAASAILAIGLADH